MKKLFLAVAMTLLSLSAVAQNLQLHYDFGDGREYVTTTFEMFRLDDYGSTFTFIDFDYSGNDAPGQAYWEISRSFTLGEDPFGIEPRVEYNGGLAYLDVDYGYAISNSYLLGAQKTWASKDFSKIFTLQVNYKYIQSNGLNQEGQSGFQITGVWGMNFFDNKFTVCGFADFWREDVRTFPTNSVGSAKYVFITEPQFWYNINSAFSVGTEIEISSNFGTNDGFMVNPTVGVKWNI